MKNKKNMLFFSILLTASTLFGGGIEISFLVSGKLFVGLGYRHYFDPNTSLRLRVSSSITGSPVALSAHVFQDLNPQEKWTPIFGLGVESFFYMKDKKLYNNIMPSASGGFAFKPNPYITHHVEANVLHFPQSNANKPFGLGYSVINRSIK